MHLLRLAHRYLGIVLALLVLAMAVSGTGLLFKEPLRHARYPQLAAPVPELGTADHAAAMTELMRRHPGAIRFVRWPQPGQAAYEVWFDDGSRGFFEPATLDLIGRRQWHESAAGVLEAVHFSLLAGPRGEHLTGYVGLAALVMVLSGLVLWWPARKQSLLRGLWPARFHRGLLIRSHRHWGVLAAPLLLFVLATGTGVVFYGPLAAGLNAVFGTAPPSTPAPPPAAVDVRQTAVRAAIDRAMQRFPEGRIVFFYPHSQQAPFYKVRIRQPAELHPSGSTFVYADARTGEVLGVRDAVNAPVTHRFMNSLYPLHAAKLDSPLVTPMMLLTGLALVFIAISGVLAYWRYITPSKR